MYRIDERLDAVPSLATGPPIADPDDPLRLTWTIHDDRVWDDGTAVTTADIVATFEYLTAPATSAQRTLLYDDVGAVRAIDDTTLEIDLAAPTGAEYLMFSTIHPIIKDATWRSHLAAGGTAADFLVDGVTDAAGPYRLASRQNPGEITLGPNDTWTGEAVPTLDRVRFASYADSDALVEAQRRREVDVIWVDDVAGDELIEARAIEDTTTAAGTSTIAVQLTLNTASEPLNDARVRQAILHAIDRESIADTAVGRKTGELADPWNSLIFSPGQQGDEEPFSDQFDLDEANRLLDEAGWTRPDDTVFRRRDGEDLALDIVLLNDADGVNTALAIEDDLQAIGIDVTGLPGTTELTNERLSTGAFDLLLQFRLFNSDPLAAELSFGSNGCPPTVPGCSGTPNGVNVGAFADPAIDELFEQATTISDPTRRATVFAAIDEALLAAVPAVPLYVEPAFTAYDDEVVGIAMAPNLGPLTDLASWGLVEP
jgi:peptide/nickel transport system substrate-binding protein